MGLRFFISPIGQSHKPPYKIGEILLELSTVGTRTIDLKDGCYEIYCIGGGGGGSNNAGGSGAGLFVRVYLKKGTYTCIVGSGGAGASAYVRNNNGYPGNGSSIKGVSASIISGGGAGRNGRRNGGGGGTTGAISYNFSNKFKILRQTNAGAEYALSFLNGTNYGPGAGGIAQSNDTGAGYAGKAGYIKITYVGFNV